MSWKQFVAGYLTFSRKDRAGVLVLLLLVVLAFALPYFAPTTREIPVPLDIATFHALEHLEKAGSKQERLPDDSRYYAFERAEAEPSFTGGELFPFDPNILDDAGWKRLGLSERTIRTINNYRSKGGRFYRTEDLAKIWGLPKGFYERVKNHVQIAQQERRFEEKPRSPMQVSFSRPAPALIDLNTADTSALIALPGIGSKLAARIVNFRSKLGGFVSVEQMGETYGLPDSTFQKIRHRLVANEIALHQININKATKEVLSSHPYINWKLANAIVAFREQHGPFETVEDLKKILILDENTLNKVRPYLTTQ